MRERVAESLNRVVPQAGPPVSATKPYLGARTVADRLLPEGFGNDGRRGSAEEGVPGTATTTGSNRSKLPRLEIRRLEYHEQGFTLRWRLIWNGKPASADLRLLVDTEASPLSKGSWTDEGLGSFPLSVRQARSEPLPPVNHGRNDWSVSIEKRPDLPGIRVVPMGSKLGPEATLTVDGTLEVDVINPKGAPVRSVLVVDRVPGQTS